MPFYLPPKILGKIHKKALFINPSCFLPPVLFMTQYSLLEVLWK
jgi:hypothetical protein